MIIPPNGRLIVITKGLCYKLFKSEILIYCNKMMKKITFSIFVASLVFTFCSRVTWLRRHGECSYKLRTYIFVYYNEQYSYIGGPTTYVYYNEQYSYRATDNICMLQRTIYSYRATDNMYTTTNNIAIGRPTTYVYYNEQYSCIWRPTTCVYYNQQYSYIRQPTTYE